MAKPLRNTMRALTATVLALALLLTLYAMSVSHDEKDQRKTVATQLLPPTELTAFVSNQAITLGVVPTVYGVVYFGADSLSALSYLRVFEREAQQSERPKLLVYASKDADFLALLSEQLAYPGLLPWHDKDGALKRRCVRCDNGTLLVDFDEAVVLRALTTLADPYTLSAHL